MAALHVDGFSAFHRIAVKMRVRTIVFPIGASTNRPHHRVDPVRAGEGEDRLHDALVGEPSWMVEPDDRDRSAHDANRAIVASGLPSRFMPLPRSGVMNSA